MASKTMTRSIFSQFLLAVTKQGNSLTCRMTTCLILFYRESLIQDKNGIRICSDLDREHGHIDFGKMNLTESAKITEIMVNNAGSSTVKLKRFAALDSVGDFMLSDKHNVTMSGPKHKVIRLPAGKAYTIQALFKPSSLGEFKQPIVFEFEEESTAKAYHIARFLTGQGTSDDVEGILPTQKYQHPKPFARVVDPDVLVIGGVPPPR